MIEINIPEKGIDWLSLPIGQARITKKSNGDIVLRLLLDDSKGQEIGFVLLQLYPEIVIEETETK